MWQSHSHEHTVNGRCTIRELVNAKVGRATIHVLVAVEQTTHVPHFIALEVAGVTVAVGERHEAATQAQRTEECAIVSASLCMPQRVSRECNTSVVCGASGRPRTGQLNTTTVLLTLEPLAQVNAACSVREPHGTLPMLPSSNDHASHVDLAFPKPGPQQTWREDPSMRMRVTSIAGERTLVACRLCLPTACLCLDEWIADTPASPSCEP